MRKASSNASMRASSSVSCSRSDGVLPVHFLQHVELVALLFRRQAFLIQKFDRLLHQIVELHAGVADGRSLIGGGQESAAPVFRAAVRERRLDGDESGQILILAAEAVDDPRPHGRARERVRAGVKLEAGAAVRNAIAHHGAHQAQIVGAFGDVRKQAADPESALAVLLEFPGRLHQIAHVALGERERPLERQRLLVPLLERGLVVERIDAAKDLRA